MGALRPTHNTQRPFRGRVRLVQIDTLNQNPKARRGLSLSELPKGSGHLAPVQLKRNWASKSPGWRPKSLLGISNPAPVYRLRFQLFPLQPLGGLSLWWGQALAPEGFAGEAGLWALRGPPAGVSCSAKEPSAALPPPHCLCCVPALRPDYVEMQQAGGGSKAAAWPARSGVMV